MTYRLQAADLKIELLTDAHDLTQFRSYESDLVAFLLDDALLNQEQKLSLTTLWFCEGRLVGYLTLLNDKIGLEGNLKQFFKEKDILYKSLPSLKIGRLCVHDDFLRRGLGRLMVIFAIQQANSINRHIAGCRFITLDAKRNKDPKLDSIHFYNRLGFKTLKERSKGTTPMYLDLKLNS